MDRALHDSLMVVKRVLESSSVVAGGGAVEAALSIYLENFATTLSTREQLAIAEFAEALLVIPKTLACNAAQDATELVAMLRAHHNTAQFKPGKERRARARSGSGMKLSPPPRSPSPSLSGKERLKHSGLDLVSGEIRDNLSVGVVEPAISKIKSLRFATEAAITILRIDDMIKLAPKEGQQQ